MIPLFKVVMSERAVPFVASVLGSGFIGQGPAVDAFERELSQYTPMYPISTNSCTSAIHMVLQHLGVGPGDELITTPLTCVATNAPILAVGARPVWADIDPVFGLISPEDVKRKITARTKAIIAVDWTGKSCDYTTLKSFGIPVIQDAAHGPLIKLHHGDYICYSFGPIKHLVAGDGGAVACAPEHRSALRLLRWYGLDRTSSRDFRCAQNITLPGLKWHMNDINAAIGRANLVRLPDMVAAHQENALNLAHRIMNPLVKVAPYDEFSNYWVFPVRLSSAANRDRFKLYMESRGIACSQVHARNDKHTAYDFPSGPLPGVDEFDARQANIPCGSWLTDEDLDTILTAVNSYRGNAS